MPQRRANFYDNLTVFWCPSCDTLCHRQQRMDRSYAVICTACEVYAHLCYVPTQQSNTPNWDGRVFGRRLRPRADSWQDVDHNFYLLDLNRVRMANRNNTAYEIIPVEDVISTLREQGRLS